MIKYTREDILRMPVSGRGSKPGLRQVAAELGIKMVEENGEIISAYSAKKPALQETLLALIEDSSNEDSTTVEDLDSLAERYWKQIKEATFKQYYADKLGEQPYYHADNGELGRIALEFTLDLSMRPSDKSATGLIEPATVKKLKSQVKADIVALISADQDTRLQAHLPHAKLNFNELFGYLEDVDGVKAYRAGLIDRALSKFTIQKRKAEDVKVLERKRNQPRKVRVTNLYQWALTTLESYSTKNFKDISLALMLVTGRRPSEIHATAKFAPTDKPNWALFEGQLKTKGRTDAEPVYEIPILAPIELIIGALDHLGNVEKKRIVDDGSRQENRAKKANATWGTDLNKRAKDIDRVYLAKTEVDGTEQVPNLTCNGCRDIYAQTVSKLFRDGYQNLFQLGKFLGHREGDSGTTERYELDYEVLETTEELQALFNLAQPALPSLAQ